MRNWMMMLFAFGMVLAAGASQPNIIFVLCDDLGYGDLGVLFQNDRVPGLPKHATPQLDSMALAGMQMRRHYCPAPVCAPSRASLLNGVHQGHATVRNNQFDKALGDNHTLASVLREAGYATAAFGKWGLRGSLLTVEPDREAHPLRRGFDYYYGYMAHVDGHRHYPKEDGKTVYENYTNVTADLDLCYTTDLFAARAKKWITDHLASPDADKPMFLYLAHDTPHAILQYPPSAYPAGGGLSGGLQWVGTPGSMINAATGSYDSYVHPDYDGATYDDDGNAGTPEVAWPEVYKRYAGSVRRIDDTMGDLLKLLEDLDIATNTLVVFTSDNGPSIEDYLSLNYAANFFDNYGPFDGIKRDIWEGGVRMATLAYWPGTISSNMISQTPSAFWDWMPTFSEMAGVPAPANTDGVSLLPTLTGQGTQRDSTIYIEYYNNTRTPSYSEFVPAHRNRKRNEMQSVQLDGFKGIRYDVSTHADDFEIYDVANDPQEANNLALNAAYDGLQQRMKDRVLQLRRPNTSAPRPYDSEYVPADTIQSAFANATVNFAAYEGAWPWLPDFQSMASVATGTVSGIDLSVRPRAENYGLLYSGYLEIPVNGSYTFYLTSDAGANLRIHDALVIDDDFKHNGSTVSGSIRLAAGRHPFRLSYRHLTGSETLSFQYTGPGILLQDVPDALFVLPVDGMAAEDDTAETTQNTSVLIDVLANDAPESVAILSVSAPSAGTAIITNNAILYHPNSGFLGKDSFTYTATADGETDVASVDVNVNFTDGLLWFPFNDTYALESRTAGGAFSVLLSGYADPDEPWQEGKHGRALHLSGTGQSGVVSGFNGILGAAPRSQMAWIRTTNTTQRAIVGWGERIAGGKWSFTINGDGKIRHEVESGYIVGTAVVNDGQWHHVALTFAGGDIADALLYVDGQSDAISSVGARTVNTQSGGSMTVGIDNQNRRFDGDIDELRIYDRALSSSEIQAVYSATNQVMAAWVRRYFGEATVDWNSDDDDDGGKLLLEYAMGGQPWISDSQAMMIQSDIQTERLIVRYPRRVSGTHDLTYTVQVSEDLEEWSTLAYDQFTSSVNWSDPAFEEVKIELDPPFGETGSFFVRLFIEL